MSTMFIDVVHVCVCLFFYPASQGNTDHHLCNDFYIKFSNTNRDEFSLETSCVSKAELHLKIK